MLEGVLIDEAMEGLFQLACHFRRSSRAGAIDQAFDSLAGKTMAPLAERGRGKGEGVRDGVQTLPFHDVAHGLGTAEDTGFFGLLDEGVSGRERVIGKVQFEGPHLRVSSHKLLQKYEHPPSHDVVTLLAAHNLSDSNFQEAAQLPLWIGLAACAASGQYTIRSTMCRKHRKAILVCAPCPRHWVSSKTASKPWKPGSDKIPRLHLSHRRRIHPIKSLGGAQHPRHSAKRVGNEAIQAIARGSYLPRPSTRCGPSRVRVGTRLWP